MGFNVNFFFFVKTCSSCPFLVVSVSVGYYLLAWSGWYRGILKPMWHLLHKHMFLT
jgi:hypothetical protein